MMSIIEREEKGSDVNLASYLLLDAFNREYDLAVVVSNDSDLAEPIRLVRSEFGLRVRIVNPRKFLAYDSIRASSSPTISEASRTSTATSNCGCCNNHSSRRP
jgi:uncharacterized LabA/DUF88 family protein